MKKGISAVTVVAFLLVGCGGSASTEDGAAAQFASCLIAAGAVRATDAAELGFAQPWAVTHEIADREQGSLSLGAYRGRSYGGWEVFYAARKGVRVSLAVLGSRPPSKSARVVAYVHPRDAETMRKAEACLGR
jgi:hypothetical protein